MRAAVRVSVRKLLPILGVLISFPALADTPRAAFDGLLQCLSREADACRDYFTEDSQPLYDKVVTYELARCVPQDVEYVSEITKGGVKFVRARIREGKSERVARLAFSRENAVWKMNVPETLKHGIGPKWQAYVNATEQGYLFMQAQMGKKIGCDAVKVLAVQAKE